MRHWFKRTTHTPVLFILKKVDGGAHEAIFLVKRQLLYVATNCFCQSKVTKQAFGYVVIRIRRRLVNKIGLRRLFRRLFTNEDKRKTHLCGQKTRTVNLTQENLSYNMYSLIRHVIEQMRFTAK